MERIRENYDGGFPNPDRRRSPRQMPWRSQQPAVLWNSSQSNQRFNVKCLRKQIEHGHLGNFVAITNAGSAVPAHFTANSVARLSARSNAHFARRLARFSL